MQPHSWWAAIVALSNEAKHSSLPMKKEVEADAVRMQSTLSGSIEITVENFTNSILLSDLLKVGLTKAHAMLCLFSEALQQVRAMPLMSRVPVTSATQALPALPVATVATPDLTVNDSDAGIDPVAQSMSTLLTDSLHFQSIPNDGHCLFHAIGIYVGQQASFLRQIVAANLKANKEEYLAVSGIPEEEMNQRIRGISETNLWGGQLEMLVLQKVLDRPIIVIRSDASPTIFDDVDAYDGEPIYVYYNGSSHYDGLLLATGVDGRMLLQEIRDSISAGDQLEYQQAESASEQAALCL